MDHRKDEGGTDEVQIGMKVYSEAEAFNICNRYAIMKGFSLRKGNRRTDVSGKLRQRDFLCSKAGFQIDADLNEVKRGSKFDIRTGCNALIRFTVEDGVWEITRLNPSHNHELATPAERQFLRSVRRLPDYHLEVLSSRPTNSYSFMSKDVSGSDNVGLTKKDGERFLQRENDLLLGGDVQNLINHFKQKQMGDPNFFHTVQVDQLNRLTNFFWRDGKSKLDYDCFGDVVVFDTSFRTKKHNLICALFLGVNHHWKNVLFGCAFLFDQSSESFAWLFEAFLQSMGNRQPKTIFTEEDQAISNSIELVFPEARHQWCSTSSLDTFSANIRSNQRSESTKNIFLEISKEMTDLVSFVHHYETKLEEMRWAELKEDFCCKHKEPHLIVRSGMLIHAANVYTTTMFKFFENEFISCMGVRMKQVGDDGGVVIYEANEEDHIRVYIVQFNSLTGMVCCSCKLFESMGLLCRHALKVLDLKNFTSIPAQYILKRWTKEAKKGIMLSNLCESSNKNVKSAQSLRLSELMHEGINVFSIGSLTESGTKIVKEKLAEVMKILEDDVEIMDIMQSSNKGGDLFVHENLTHELPMSNSTRAKGIKHAKFESDPEERKKKAAKIRSASHVSQPNDTVSGQLNQAIDNQTSFDLSFHQDAVLEDQDFDNQVTMEFSL